MFDRWFKRKHIKTEALCDSCKFNVSTYCMKGRCTECPLASIFSPHCRCLTIKKGKKCPYYKEDTGEGTP